MHTYKSDAVASLERLQEKLEKVNLEITRHTQVVSQGDINIVSHSSNNVQRSISGTVKEMQRLVDKFTPNSASSGSINWSGYDIFTNHSTAELGAIAHISVSVFILYTLFNILLIV